MLAALEALGLPWTRDDLLSDEDRTALHISNGMFVIFDGDEWVSLTLAPGPSPPRS